MHTNAITVLLLSSVALASHIPSAARRHHENRAVDVEKRGGSARFSWYDITTNEVACGGRYQPNDYVVALDAAQWDGGSHCGEKVTLTYNGKTATATIVDECAEGCPNNALDLTHGLFQNLIGSPEVIGISYGEFSFGSAPKPEPVTTKEKPTPTSTPPPPPPPPTSTTHTTTKEKTTSIAPTTTSVQPTATSSSSSSAAASSSAPIAVPTAPGVSLGIASIAGTVDSSTTQNLVEISNAMVNFGVVVLSA